MPTKVMVVFGEVIYWTLFDTTIKDKHANLKVEFSMEEGTSILVQP
jgi:hypothetical protein